MVVYKASMEYALFVHLLEIVAASTIWIGFKIPVRLPGWIAVISGLVLIAKMADGGGLLWLLGHAPRLSLWYVPWAVVLIIVYLNQRKEIPRLRWLVAATAVLSLPVLASSLFQVIFTTVVWFVLVIIAVGCCMDSIIVFIHNAKKQSTAL